MRTALCRLAPITKSALQSYGAYKLHMARNMLKTLAPRGVQMAGFNLEKCKFNFSPTKIKL